MALIYCTYCGKRVSDKAITCPHCGASLEEEVRQGILLQQDAEIRQGTPIQQAGQEPTPEPANDEEGGSNAKWWIVVIIILLAGGFYAFSRFHGVTDATASAGDTAIADTAAVDTPICDTVAVDTTWDVDSAAADTTVADYYESESSSHDWMQGTWSINTIVYGKRQLVQLVISGSYATIYANGEVLDRGEYSISNGRLWFGDTCLELDEYREAIMYDANHYFQHTSNPTNQPFSVTSQEQDREMEIMAQLKELQNDGRALLDELSAMRRSGRMDPMRFMYIQQATIGFKEQQAQLAEELGDREMARQYRQQKEQLRRSFQMMENGY